MGLRSRRRVVSDDPPGLARLAQSHSGRSCRWDYYNDDRYRGTVTARASDRRARSLIHRNRLASGSQLADEARLRATPSGHEVEASHRREAAGGSTGDVVETG